MMLYSEELNVDGTTYTLKVYSGAMLYKYFWVVVDAKKNVVAKCPCMSEGHRHPRINARRYIRQGQPRTCQTCDEDWCKFADAKEPSA